MEKHSYQSFCDYNLLSQINAFLWGVGLILLSIQSLVLTDQSQIRISMGYLSDMMFSILNFLEQINARDLLMAQNKTVVSPLLTHWRYCSIALSHRCTFFSTQMDWIIYRSADGLTLYWWQPLPRWVFCWFWNRLLKHLFVNKISVYFVHSKILTLLFIPQRVPDCHFHSIIHQK